MGLRKRISESRERGARERAKRREERRRAERAKAGATAADRSQARIERKKAKAEEKTKSAAKAEPRPMSAAKPKAESKPTQHREPKSRSKEPPKPEPKAKVTAKPKAKAEPKAKLAAAKPRRGASAGKGAQAVAAGAGKAGTAVRSVVTEVLKLGREMVAIPVALWLAAAEFAGAFVLRAWLRVVRPLLLWLWRTVRAALRYAQDHVKPAHGVIAVALVAIGALVASQWLDYHEVTVGTDAYSGTVGDVAPAPVVESDVAGSAHAWLMLPLAALALIVLTIALTGRRKAAALLIPIGLIVIAIALIVDVPKGLDEGTASVAYEGASARLLGGFWLQLAAAVSLIGCGLLLPRYLRPAPAREAAAPTGPTLFQRGATAARKFGKRRPQLKRRRPPGRRVRPKRKVQGAGT
jgi:hypothetical protein